MQIMYMYPDIYKKLRKLNDLNEDRRHANEYNEDKKIFCKLVKPKMFNIKSIILQVTLLIAGVAMMRC